jgi:hypothetical protein
VRPGTSIRVNRPPLGETGGAAMSQLRPAVERYATARIDANRVLN